MTKPAEKKNLGGREVSTPADRGDAVAAPRPSLLSRDWFLGLVLVLAVILTYQPVWWAGYIWDDNVCLTANPCIVGPLGLKEIWTTNTTEFCPLVFTTFWVEHQLWGLAPLPYHLVNVVMHAGCAILLWQVLRSLQAPGAWLGAALWALHPLQVESVAWVAELKNTQSGLFYLLTILFFVKWLRALDGPTASSWNYALTLLFAALAMVSKSSTVILPGVLCLCAWWVEGRWRWRNLARVAPILFIAIAASAFVMIWTQNLGGDGGPPWVRSWPERMAAAGDVIWFYLGKLVWPHPLIVTYPGWEIDAGRWFAYLPLLAVIVILFILWSKRESWYRPGFFAFAYFLAALFPVLGFVTMSSGSHNLVGDHLQYLAGMGPLALAGAGLARFSDFALPKRAWWRVIICAGLLLMLGTLSWQRTWDYETEETLWNDTLAKNPSSWLARHYLGDVFLQQGRLDEAIVQYQKVLGVEPKFIFTNINLGIALSQKGRLDEAMAQYQKTLAINPNLADVHNNLGNILLQKGRAGEAMAQFQKALEIDPTDAKARYNLGNILSQNGQQDEAMDQYQQAVEIDPNSVEARNNLGAALLQKGDLDGAIAQCQEAVNIDSNSMEAHNNLGTAFLRKGLLDEAIEQCQEVLAINPKSVVALNNLSYALLQKGQVDEAMAQVQQVLKIDPTNAEAHYNLGNALLQKRQLDGAIAQYQKALALNPKMTQVHLNLGNALLQTGRMDEAIGQYQQALALNPNSAGAHGNLGFALSQKGKLDEAMVQFQKALALNPNIVQVHDNFGAALVQKGRLDEATAQFQQALQLNPADAVAQSSLAKMQATARQNPAGPKSTPSAVSGK